VGCRRDRGSGAGSGSIAAYLRWQEITPRVLYPGRTEGHYLRELLREHKPCRRLRKPSVPTWPSSVPASRA
jgi:hypothetical protein